MSRYRRQKPASTASSALRLLAVAAGLVLVALLWSAVRPTAIGLLARANLGNPRALRLLQQAVAERHPELGNPVPFSAGIPAVQTFGGRRGGVLWGTPYRAYPPYGPTWVVLDERLNRTGEFFARLYNSQSPAEDRNADGSLEVIGALREGDVSVGWAVVRVEPSQNTLLAVIEIGAPLAAREFDPSLLVAITALGLNTETARVVWTDRDEDGWHELELLSMDNAGGSGAHYRTALTLRWTPEGRMVCDDQPPPGVRIWTPFSWETVAFSGGEPLHEVVQRVLSGR